MFLFENKNEDGILKLNFTIEKSGKVVTSFTITFTPAELLSPYFDMDVAKAKLKNHESFLIENKQNRITAINHLVGSIMDYKRKNTTNEGKYKLQK